MRLCYIDESGDTGAFTLDNVNSQLVFLLTALFMPQEHLANVTRSALSSSRPLGFVDWLLLVRAQALIGSGSGPFCSAAMLVRFVTLDGRAVANPLNRLALSIESRRSIH